MKNLSRITLRIPQSISDKIAIMAKENSRSKNKEVETAIKRYINDYERHNGTIEIK